MISLYSGVENNILLCCFHHQIGEMYAQIDTLIYKHLVDKWNTKKYTSSIYIYILTRQILVTHPLVASSVIHVGLYIGFVGFSNNFNKN